ncbi:hypothetical protein FCI23_32275 [Actinacidiphila oryziradicis]|uniref:Uncharacterized protein n=1 Tax=Actinacidiphila oryziradicis TaxID=2571141 RepID=A0A4U0SDR8_9ACTN|nr:hypothetical protein FCI23_32275 [Actinacidiphila oryziradicis]
MDRDREDETGPQAPDPDPDARREPSTHQLRLFLVLAEEPHFGRPPTGLPDQPEYAMGPFTR